MTGTTVKRLTCIAAVLFAVVSPRSAYAQLGIGTWARTDTAAGGTPQLTMTVESCCKGGFRILYRLEGRGEVMMSIDSPMDGTDAPVIIGGKPSGETMGIKRVDPLHAVTVLKMNGKQFGTSRLTLSADGKTLSVENEVTSAGQSGMPVGKTTEKWALRK
jgi:hypothetical protein